MIGDNPPPLSDAPKNPQPELCPYCCKPLAATRARFCTECNNWQDYRGWFWSQISIGDISLYGSIILLLFTTFQSTLLGKHAKIHATALSCSGYAVQVHVANSGSSMAIVTSARLQAIQGIIKGPQTSAAYVRTDGSSDPQTVSPDSHHVLALALADNDRASFFDKLTPTDPSCLVHVVFDAIVDASATKEPVPVAGSCSCPDFAES